MSHNAPYKAYHHATETMDTGAQIILLYDKALSYIKQAKEAIKNNDHDQRYQLVDKTISIIHGLRACLDFGANEELAAAMDRYYDSLDKLLIAVQNHQDEKLCNAILENLKVIRDAWESINITTEAKDKSDLSEEENTKQDIIV